ncbi:hypothetical protein BOX15_Mlig013414g1 [Macrostomum lignano]|uniref:MARVEL domain-containing protein n=1 Tax=Macrostomum lignano TaxID=282301 RepID=A0A267H515_9PLAT|nr:hypothetical protein BOX15_Mlig013414g1 [Macrostomum lignano]
MSSSDTNQSSGAIYHHVSPTVTLVYRVVSGLALLFALSSILITLIQGGVVSASFFLLTLNLLLSCSLIGQLWWWHRTGDLSEDRIYVVFAAMGILAFQCLTTIIWVFNYQLSQAELIPAPCRL